MSNFFYFQWGGKYCILTVHREGVCRYLLSNVWCPIDPFTMARKWLPSNFCGANWIFLHSEFSRYFPPCFYVRCVYCPPPGLSHKQLICLLAWGRIFNSTHSLHVGDVIFTPNDKISVRKCTNATWAAIRGAHKIPKKKKQDEGNTRGLIHQRSYAEVAAASA